MHCWQRRITGDHGHHASCCHEHAFHVDATVFVPQDIHHGLGSYVTCTIQEVFALKMKVSILMGPNCTRKPEKLTIASFQHLLALTVSAASFFYPGGGHEGVDCGKVELGLSVPPAFALCIFPQVWVLFIYLGCYSILIGDVSITL